MLNTMTSEVSSGVDGEKSEALALSLGVRSGVSSGNGESQFVDVTPTGGTLVIFDSVDVMHEVLKTRRERLAAVGWLYCNFSV